MAATERPVRLSIVIATHNRADLVARAVASVLDQEDADVEVIVVDDASTDATLEVLDALHDDRLRVIHQEVNTERGAARNRGAAAAAGDYVGFLDSDDLLKPDHYRNVARVVTAHDSPAWLHLGFEVRGEDGELQAVVDDLVGDVRPRLLREANLMGLCGVALRRDVALAFPFPVDRRLAGMAEDYLLWLRIASTHPIVADPAVTSVVLAHPGRSMATGSIADVLERRDAVLELARSDALIQRAFGGNLGVLEANLHYFVARRLAQLGAPRRWSLGELARGLRAEPRTARSGWCRAAVAAVVRWRR
jgi:glycosyltransferase involved in cell wall biosynthesis